MCLARAGGGRGGASLLCVVLLGELLPLSLGSLGLHSRLLLVEEVDLLLLEGGRREGGARWIESVL